jgi:DNA invertase Pin-like site-specific DNA recombinase
LTMEQVCRIRSRYAPARKIAEDYGISRHTVYDIWERQSWKAS